MREMNYTEQQYLQILERSLRIIRSGEHLSHEASIEELCKLLLINICFERRTGSSIKDYVLDFEQNNEEIQRVYYKVFQEYVPIQYFAGWENLRIGYTTLFKVVDELTQDSRYSVNREYMSKAFTDFLQIHYSGYLSEYSTPQKLNDYIMDVINPNSNSTIADPCCGLGGMLVAGGRQNVREIYGYDINRKMVNTANLHLMMYGYEECQVESADILMADSPFFEKQYDIVVSHLPNRHQAFSHASVRKGYSGNEFPKNIEDGFIHQILRMLKPGGIAAIVVSDELLFSASREESRRWLNDNAKIENITRFDGLSHFGSSNVRSYNVVFLSKQKTSVSNICSATLFPIGTEEIEIERTGLNLGRGRISDVSRLLDIDYTRSFNISNERNWNVSFFFVREKMGVNYTTAVLGDIVRLRRDRVRILNDESYIQLTVKSKGLGVVERKEKYIVSASSNNERYIARADQLIISSLEADKGAVGIVPIDLQGAVVSKNYYLFDINRQVVDQDYLVMILSSEPVLKQMGFIKQGAVMSRVSIEKLLSVVIPLPDLEEQKELVKPLIKKVHQARQVQDELEMEHKDFSRRLFGEEM